MYRLITLDATNTLLRVKDSVGIQYSKAALQMGYKLDPETTEKYFKKAFKMQYKKHQNFGVEDGISTKDWWNEVVHKTVERFIPSHKIAQLSSNLYEEFSKETSWEVFPEVFEVLSQLKKRNYTLGVLSNFDERLSVILDTLKLKEFFSFVICSTEVKLCKPSPAIFKLALQKAACEPSEVLHIGDNYELDFKAAKSLGIKALLLQRQGNIKQSEVKVDADEIISDLTQVLDFCKNH